MTAHRTQPITCRSLELKVFDTDCCSSMSIIKDVVKEEDVGAATVEAVVTVADATVEASMVLIMFAVLVLILSIEALN